MFKSKLFLSLTGAALLLGGINSAKAITLADLISGGGFLDSGDKRFSEFFYARVGDMPAASAITVVPITDIYGNYGLRFLGNFHDIAGGSASDGLIKYMVSVTDPNRFLSDAHIVGNPSVVGGSGAMQVSETFLPEDGVHDMSIFALNDGTGNSNSQLSDTSLLSGNLTGLHVQKDIFAFSGTGFASMSYVDQTFSQGFRNVPEPGSLALMGAGVIGSLGMFSRRRKKA